MTFSINLVADFLLVSAALCCVGLLVTSWFNNAAPYRRFMVALVMLNTFLILLFVARHAWKI